MDNNQMPFVFHNDMGKKVSVELLQKIEDPSDYLKTGALAAKFTKNSRYPGSWHNTMEGLVVVTENDAEGASATSQKVLLKLDKLSPMRCDTSKHLNCGYHIHVGTTCDDAKKVGGHYFNKEAKFADPWGYVRYGAKQQYAVATVETGFKLAELKGHAFVLHNAQGERVSCELLMDADVVKNGDRRSLRGIQI